MYKCLCSFTAIHAVAIVIAGTILSVSVCVLCRRKKELSLKKDNQVYEISNKTYEDVVQC